MTWTKKEEQEHITFYYCCCFFTIAMILTAIAIVFIGIGESL